MMYIKLLLYYLDVIRFERVSDDVVASLQIKRFRKLFEYAKEHSPFYQELYREHGVYDLEILSKNEIEKVPIVNKSMLRNRNWQDIACKPVAASSLNSFKTSGSTGEPFEIFVNKYEDYTSHIRVLRGLQREGYNPSKTITMITRYNVEDRFGIERDLGLIEILQKKLGLFRRNIVSIYEPVDKIIEKLEKSPPDILWSTPSILQIVAEELQKREIRLNLPVVFLTSENIFPSQWSLFREVIAKRVVDLYGAAECPTIALGHDSQTKQVFPNSAFLEYTSDEKGYQEGETKLIVTNLVNFTMPFIRYDLNDFVENPEDLSFPARSLGRILGRSDDVIQLASGAHLAHHHAHDMFRDFDDVDQWKFVQYDNRLELQLKFSSRSTVIREETFGKAQEIWKERYPRDELQISSVSQFELDSRTGKVKNIERRTG